MKNRGYFILGLIATVILGLAAVWMGGLNQDEGWYLYAANLVSEGKVLYRDFAFTQAPLMPIVYSVFAGIWQNFGLLGARLFTLTLGLLSIFFLAMSAVRLTDNERKWTAGTVVMLLLGCNLYHLYYIAIPKTYALAALMLAIGVYLLTFERMTFFAGMFFALACGTRISLGAAIPVICLLLWHKRSFLKAVIFGLGAVLALALVFGPYLISHEAKSGLLMAQAYHVARGGYDPVFAVGSLSRLVRWYLPIFIVFGLSVKALKNPALLWAFIAVFLVQILAPFPYDDYQVPIMGILAVVSAVAFTTEERPKGLLLVLGLTFATSFGSPLLETWTMNGQDRFWSLKKEQCELKQLQETAAEINVLDPGGKELLTQDLYLAIETNRKVPEGLEMGPFSVLSDAEWRKLLDECKIPVAALSGYTFAIEPPECNERSNAEQIEYWKILKRNYRYLFQKDRFGQNATTLLILQHQ